MKSETIFQDYLPAIITALENIINGGIPFPIAVPEAGHPQAELVRVVNSLIVDYASVYEYMLALARGDLSVKPPHRNQMAAPFKELHANLNHLTWQTQQIASGDLNQHVDFMGDFSNAFNRLIQTLREKREIEEQLHYMSVHDALTGVYNRAFFNGEIQRLSKGRSYPISILMIDLDGLKRVNDCHGHEAGDEYICAAASLINESLRGDEVVARIGGDEFAILLPTTDNASAVVIKARIRAQERSENLRNRLFPVGLSIGVATALHEGQINETIRLADERMYADKARRKALLSS
jgi:two-component system cell cycle response regulator